MKLSLASLPALLFLIAVALPARASPRVIGVDDALADGEIDTEDLLARGVRGSTMMRSAPGGQTWVSIGGFTRRTISDEREVGGFVVVGLPFDRVARPSTRPPIVD